MSIIHQRLFALLLLVTWISFGHKTVAQQQEYQTLQDALFSAGMLSGETGPSSVNWIDGGERFSYIQETDDGPEIRSYHPESKRDERIFRTHGVTFPGQDKAFEYTAFQWSKDSKYILFQTNFRPVWRRSGISDFYFYAVADKSLKLVAKDAQTAEISPDGRQVGFERGGNLFVFDFETQKESQLTFDAKEHFYNGRFGWVYEEEFGLAQAWKWSPDSKYIAYWQSDEREVPIFQMTDYAGQHAGYVNVPYPKVGDTNPSVKIGVLNVAKKSNRWMDVKLDGGYIPRLYWTSKPGNLAIVHLNRKQNHLKLFFNNITTGQGKLIMEEKSEKWIDVFDFFAEIMHLLVFPENTEEFFWISDRDGWSHIYRYDYEGNVVNQVTKGKWEVTRLEAVNAKKKIIYYTSTEESPLERHLYSINFSGKNKKKLTTAPGRHNFNVAPNGQYYIDSYSDVSTPLQVELSNSEGQMLKKFEDNQAVSYFISSHFYAPRELISFETSDGVSLDGYLLKPKDFDPKKEYPLILNIYGGPGAQSVYNEFGRDTWEQYLVQEGYLVASLNNRGSGGYGRDFEKIVYRNLGHWESKDFVALANHLAAFDWVDDEKIAIRGHSYGGYMASYTMLNYPDVFKVAIVGAPVTDWRLYDSIYTERYMDLLKDNQSGYENSSPIKAAGNLTGKMFIAHAAMDENVHVQNTMQLVRALIDHGKDADLRIFPPGAHGIAYNQASFVLLYSQYFNYFENNLK